MLYPQEMSSLFSFKPEEEFIAEIKRNHIKKDCSSDSFSSNLCRFICFEVNLTIFRGILVWLSFGRVGAHAV